MYVIIVLDMVNVTFAVICEYHPYWHDKKYIFRFLNVVFVALYMLEAILKVSIDNKYT